MLVSQTVQLHDLLIDVPLLTVNPSLKPYLAVISKSLQPPNVFSPCLVSNGDGVCHAPPKCSSLCMMVLKPCHFSVMRSLTNFLFELCLGKRSVG